MEKCIISTRQANRDASAPYIMNMQLRSRVGNGESHN